MSIMRKEIREAAAAMGFNESIVDAFVVAIDTDPLVYNALHAIAARDGGTTEFFAAVAIQQTLRIRDFGIGGGRMTTETSILKRCSWCRFWSAQHQIQESMGPARAECLNAKSEEFLMMVAEHSLCDFWREGAAIDELETDG